MSFIYLFWGVALSLLLCTLSLVVVRGPLIVVASVALEHQLQGAQASVVAAHGVSSCGPWAWLPHSTWHLPRDQTCVSCLGKQLLNQQTTSEVSGNHFQCLKHSLNFCAHENPWGAASNDRPCPVPTYPTWPLLRPPNPHLQSHFHGTQRNNSDLGKFESKQF